MTNRPPTGPFGAAAALRFAGWIDRYRWAVLAVSFVLAMGMGVLAERLPVYGDFSDLVPQDAPSVRQLHELEKRVHNFGTVMLAVVTDDPVQRSQAAQALRDRVALIDDGLISDISFDDKVTRQFIWENRFLYASLDDLKQARDHLNQEILKTNPIYVNFDDDDAQPVKEGDKTAAADGKKTGSATKLRQKLDDAEKKRDEPGTHVSDDGKMQLIVVRTSFDSGTVSKANELIDRLRAAADETRAQFPGVTIGMAGDVLSGQAEHSALLSGMLIATLLTVLVVAVGLLLYYRSIRAVGALFWALSVGVITTFGLTRILIGHLNLASAFLSSIVIGNGINFGMILLARHLEERRKGQRGVPAIATAIRGTFTGTLVAALTGAVAYGSLAATEFKGFQHFGVIGGLGMAFCWLTAYTVLPAGLAILERAGLKPGKAPAIGKLLARIAPHTHRQVTVVAVVALLVTAGAGMATVRYLSDPYEGNFRNLRSENAELNGISDWLGRIDAAFGRHISGGFALATPTREQASALAARLKKLDDGKDAEHRVFGVTASLDDVVPADQPEKLAVLADLRKKIDHNAKNLEDADREEAERLRPPDVIHPISDADIPAVMAWPFTEKDGTRGRLVLVDAGQQYDTWLAHDLLAFTTTVEGLDLGQGTLYGGSNFVFADVIRSMEGDGPKATLIALAGALLVITLLVGLRRHGAVTLVCMLSGTLLMIAGGWLLGLRVNFLDFVALPITIGIGIDYSVNIVTRERQEGTGSARAALATTGGAVLMCSFTTVVGYATLLLSANKGIKSFGTAAILGELTCVTAALVLAPALLQLLAPRRATDSAVTTTDPGDEVDVTVEPRRRAASK